MNNSLMILNPYWYNGFWVFDDEATGLVREPFVSGIPEMLDDLLKENNIPLEKAKKEGFVLVFSATAFPSYQAHAIREGEENGGNWYRNNKTNKRGWLCPALFKYFENAPDNLYVSVAEQK